MHTENETITALKKSMGYVSATECCATCQNYRAATDGMMIGGPPQQPLGNRCGLNVIEVPVSAGGRCSHYNKREL